MLGLRRSKGGEEREARGVHVTGGRREKRGKGSAFERGEEREEKGGGCM